MSWIYRAWIRPVLFEQDSERIHERTLASLNWVSRKELLCEAISTFFREELPVEVFGLYFPNPVGLAAGMDKHAMALPAWSALGFGFSELGGVTRHAQPGNPLPRIFRAIADEALINRMGLNNPGAATVAETLAEWRRSGRWPEDHVVGINIGKSAVTPLEEAAGDYAESFRALWPHADFFVVNVSSPNTPNLRRLQDKSALDEILADLQEVNRSLCETARSQGVEEASPKPILVKVAPDLSFNALDEILELIEPRDIAGLVATNTTITRPKTTDSVLARIYAEPGGLSGKPLRERSTEIIRHLYKNLRGRIPIIGVGGVFNAEDAWEKIVAGATLIQVYTGLVYEGPAIAKQIVTGLRAKLNELGLEDIKQAIGSGQL